MKAMAGEVARLAPPFFVAKLRRLPEGADDRRRARFIEDSILLDAKRFMSLFPGGRLQRERLLGLTKSIIAVR